MHPNPPSDNSTRRIEIVPLGDPRETPSVEEVLAAAAPVEPPALVADEPVDPTPGERAYPRLVLHPVPAWAAPSVRTTSHPAVGHVAMPGSVMIDLTDDAAGATVSIEVAPAHRPIALPSGRPTARTAPTGLAQDRLLAVLAREREGLAPADAPAALPVRRADVAPFPLPSSATAEGLRRVPKGLRPDASGRPLSADVAAAIARVTGRPEPSAATSDAPVAGVRRGRLELVPLGDEPEVAPAAVAAPVLDLREPKRATKRAAAHTCSACGTRGVVDVVDHVSGQAHLSCPHCFRMWREDLHTHAEVDAP